MADAVAGAGRPAWELVQGGAAEVALAEAGRPAGPSAPVQLTQVALLEGGPGDAPGPARAGRRLSALRRLASAEARLDLSLGHGIERLVSPVGTAADGSDAVGADADGANDAAWTPPPVGGLRVLGHSHFSSLCEGRFGFSAAHGRELRRLALRLPELPALRGAFVAGLVPRTRVREVVDIATAETEAGWAGAALKLGSRPLRRLVRAVRQGMVEGSPSPGATSQGLQEDDMEFERVQWLGTPADLATWRLGLAAVQVVAGLNGPEWRLAEWLAAEVLSACGPEVEDGLLPPSGGSEGHEEGCVRQPGNRSERRRLRRLQQQSERGRLGTRLSRKLARLHATEAPTGPPSAAPADALDLVVPPMPTDGDPWRLLAHVQELVRRRRAIEWERARLLRLMDEGNLHRELGFIRFTDFAERSLGLSPGEAKGLVARQREASLIPRLDAAWRAGEIDAQAVKRLAPVADSEHGEAWLAFARQVTPKQLSAALEFAKVTPGGQAGPPPADVPHSRLVLDWATHFGLRAAAETDSGAEAAPAEGGACVGPAQPPAFPPLGRLQSIGFAAPSGVARLFRAAQEAQRTALGGLLSDAEVIKAMVNHFLEVNATPDILKEHRRRHRIIDRDGWTCTMPHCRSRGPFHEHHVKFRSRGGADDESNLTTLCTACHAMVHEGFVVVDGVAPGGLTFAVDPRGSTSGGPVEVYRNERRLETPVPGSRGAGPRGPGYRPHLVRGEPASTLHSP